MALSSIIGAADGIPAWRGRTHIHRPHLAAFEHPPNVGGILGPGLSLIICGRVKAVAGIDTRVPPAEQVRLGPQSTKR